MHEKKSNEIILVVDDSPDTVSMLNDALEDKGFSVLVALSGLQAVSICKKITPDLILLDAVMPEMDGFETCKKIKENHNLESVPVIFMTGLDSEETVSSSFESGATDYIQKPIRIIELVARIKAHISKSKQINLSRKLLDSVGLSSIATDETGIIKWTTPKANELIEHSGISRVEMMNTLKPIFLSFIGDPSQEGSKLIADTNPQLAIRLEDVKDSLYIFNLVEDKPNVDEAKLLCEQFRLTEREGEVLFWVSQGKSNKELALILGISPRTVNKHLESVFEKMLVENRTSAANMALKFLNSTCS